LPHCTVDEIVARDSGLKIVVLGALGKLGWELRRALAPLSQILALSADSPAPLAGDMLDAEGLRAMLRLVRPQVIVNTVAFTDVDCAELERLLAETVNAKAPGLAQEVAALGAWLVHFSSDFVFDGSDCRPWAEDDQPAPANAYGVSKLAGECAVRDAGCRHLILRTNRPYAPPDTTPCAPSCVWLASATASWWSLTRKAPQRVQSFWQT
jgi:dTDP-4-dehydrorhamnose reductase